MMEGIEAVEVEHRPGRLDPVQPSANFGVRKKSRYNHGPLAGSLLLRGRASPDEFLQGVWPAAWGRCPSKHWVCGGYRSLDVWTSSCGSAPYRTIFRRIAERGNRRSPWPSSSLAVVRSEPGPE